MICVRCNIDTNEFAILIFLKPFKNELDFTSVSQVL